MSDVKNLKGTLAELCLNGKEDKNFIPLFRFKQDNKQICCYGNNIDIKKIIKPVCKYCQESVMKILDDSDLPNGYYFGCDYND